MTFFSNLGDEMILPQDVLIQSKETQNVQNAINATIGMAMQNGKVMKINSLEKIIKNLNITDYLPYSPTPGEITLRDLWHKKILSENPNVNPNYLSTPIITTGITQVLDLTANLFTQKKDAILLPDLFWQNYEQIFTVKLNNKLYKYQQFDNNNNYNLKSFEETLTNIKENKITIILNFPNNPTGYTPSTLEFKKLTDIINDFLKNNLNKKIVIICDDAYFGLFFEDKHKNSTLNSIEKLVDNKNCLIIKADGATKELYAWGFRIGFITYYTKDNNLRDMLLKKTQGYLRSTISSSSTIAQQAIKQLMVNENYLKEKSLNDKTIESRYKILKEEIIKEELAKYVTILPFNSGYFFTIKLPKEIDAEEFRLKLLHEHKFGVYAMDKEHIRIAFSCLEESHIILLIKKIKICIVEMSR
ncbi:aminotransferase class I/II-fold pyridoxal phosphate-dependent enzyme [Gemella sp. GH3]|uniref:aminotransferase class I/II-fold pyridoxal phosphate-dependent enzyme n=1 Tax=unclassified Gemella TaxID=2624949 RepID=UPI0015D01E7F|nr:MULTISPECIES: aminotransferase class I/II-fold pyridoxal phosphate-dependent enzyme [unclassified Gemella]MBF0714388.1 aminotransferase class I/II-fold pyridoxal phosphate-dependent enzyme [Gemella sp. GH3.1]NYS51340.1 aminotransferase class I/II-fold pyridoxal phosphate-dependent enzyme [Gemella sp. GH3]